MIMSRRNTMRTRLSEAERLDIIKLLEEPGAPSKRKVAISFGVTEGSIRKIWSNRENIKLRSAKFSEGVKNTKFRVATVKFPELETRVYKWLLEEVETGILKIPVTSTIVISKAQEFAQELSLDEFKASYRWFMRFKERKCLQNICFPDPEGRHARNKAAKELEEGSCSTSESGLIVGENLQQEKDPCIFVGYSAMYDQVVEMHQQLLCPEAQLQTPTLYEELKKSLEYFKNLLYYAKFEEAVLQSELADQEPFDERQCSNGNPLTS